MAVFTLIPEVHNFSNQSILSSDYSQDITGSLCFNENGYAGPLLYENDVHPSGDDPFSFDDKNLEHSSFVDGDTLTIRMMDGVPDGKYIDSYGLIAFQPRCDSYTIDINVNGLIQTSSAKDKLWVWEDFVGNAYRKSFNSIEYSNYNGETITYTAGHTLPENLTEIKSQGSNWDDSTEGTGTQVYAEMSIPVAEGPCAKVVIFRANTQDAFYNVDGDIFYEITINIS